jgi:uncharacterized protein
MSKAPAFWDASALVPLCLHESTSRQAQSYLHRFMPVVWWGSTVEVHSAIIRLRRSGKLNDIEAKGALARLDLLGRGWREILPVDQVRFLALQMLDSHDLRAADSLQLAAALAWCQQRPTRRTFVCGDQRLSKAADAVGFTILEL